jgi:transcriptional regulator with XRE-family HTH domain
MSKLKEWRIEHKLSQQLLADLLNKSGGQNIKQESICQWENGLMPRNPSLRLIAKITKGEVTANDFV